MLEKKEVTPAEWAANKDRFHEELLSDRRNTSAYMVKAKQKMKIAVNRETLQRVVS